MSRAYCSPSSTSASGAIFGARGNRCARSSALVVCSDSASGLDALPGQRLRHARVAHRREHQVLVADAALGAEQIDGFEHVLEIVRRLAHALKTTFTARMRRASTTWARISMLVTCRIRPLLPVMQKRQPTAQPTWVETQAHRAAAARSSTICPSANSTSRREPSLPACSDRTRARPSACRQGTRASRRAARRCAAPAAGSAGSRRVLLVQRLALQPDAHEPGRDARAGHQGGRRWSKSAWRMGKEAGDARCWSPGLCSRANY